MGQYGEEKVRCPFYISHNFRGESGGVSRIKCEGTVEGTTTDTKIKKKELLVKMTRHCCSYGYGKCKLAQVIERERYRSDEGKNTTIKK